MFLAEIADDHDRPTAHAQALPLLIKGHARAARRSIIEKWRTSAQVNERAIPIKNFCVSGLLHLIPLQFGIFEGGRALRIGTEEGSQPNAANSWVRPFETARASSRSVWSAKYWNGDEADHSSP